MHSMYSVYLLTYYILCMTTVHHKQMLFIVLTLSVAVLVYCAVVSTDPQPIQHFYELQFLAPAGNLLKQPCQVERFTKTAHLIDLFAISKSNLLPSS